jgi:thiosulfate dehydrogenase
MKSIAILFSLVTASVIWSCSTQPLPQAEKSGPGQYQVFVADTTGMPGGKYGEMVKYGYQLMMNTAYYIGPQGINGQYLGNRMNCTNCHQDGGTRPFSFNLVLSHERYPQYRAREGKVLSLTERVNNCVTRPHSGKPLPADSKEMVAFLSYFRWIHSQAPDERPLKGDQNLSVVLPERAADPGAGARLYAEHCQRCHGSNGEGQLAAGGITYLYPPLWGKEGYQPGSSMHRVIKQAQWLKANMPHDRATWDKPYLTDEQCLDLAAFVNDDRIHKRPEVKSLDYPVAGEKAIDYAHAPFIDTFSEQQHKFGPYLPIIAWWEKQGLKPTY